MINNSKQCKTIGGRVCIEWNVNQRPHLRQTCRQFMSFLAKHSHRPIPRRIRAFQQSVEHIMITCWNKIPSSNTFNLHKWYMINGKPCNQMLFQDHRVKIENVDRLRWIELRCSFFRWNGLMCWYCHEIVNCLKMIFDVRDRLWRIKNIFTLATLLFFFSYVLLPNIDMIFMHSHIQSFLFDLHRWLNRVWLIIWNDLIEFIFVFIIAFDIDIWHFAKCSQSDRSSLNWGT